MVATTNKKSALDPLRLALLALTSIAGCSSTPSADNTTSSGSTNQGSSTSSAPTSSGTVTESSPSRKPCNARLKPIELVSFAPDLSMLLTAGPTAEEPAEQGDKPLQDGSVDAWDLRQGIRAHTLHLGAQKVEQREVVHAWSADAKSVLVGGHYDGLGQHVARWDLANGATQFATSSIAFPIDIEISKDGKFGVMIGSAQQVLALELPSLKDVGSTPYNEGHQDAAISLTSDGKTAVALFGDGNVVLFPVPGLKNPKRLEALQAAHSFSPAADTVALIGPKWSGIADAKTGKKLRPLDGVPKVTNTAVWSSLSFSPDGSMILVKHEGTVYLFDASTGKKLAQAADASDGSSPTGFSPDSKVVYFGSRGYDTNLKPTDANLPAETIWISGHLAAIPKDGKLTELDALTGRTTGRAWSTKDAAGSIRVSPNGAYLAYDTTAKTLTVIRLSDNVRLQLGVLLHNGAQLGFGVSPDGDFDGPSELEGCAPVDQHATVKPKKDLIKTFFAAR